jgi:hypothetical protein
MILYACMGWSIDENDDVIECQFGLTDDFEEAINCCRDDTKVYGGTFVEKYNEGDRENNEVVWGTKHAKTA